MWTGTSKSSKPSAAVIAAAGVFLASAGWRVLTFSGFQNDHYVHLARAQQVVLGELPVRDFVDPGMPLMYLASAAAWVVAGGSPGTELLLVALGFAIGAACTTLVVHRLTGSVLLAVGAAILEIVMAPRTYSYPKVLLYALGACAIVALVESPSRGRVYVAAAVAAVAFLFRHDHGVYIGIAAALAILLGAFGSGVSGGVGEKRRASTTRAALFAGVATLLVVPWLGFVAYHQGLGNYVASGLAFSRAEAERNRGPLGLPAFHFPLAELVSVAPPFRPRARIEWTSDTTDVTRSELETRYGLEPVAPDDTSAARDYHARRLSPDDVRALAEDPHVEDAQGLDRFTEWSDRDALMARLAPSRLRIGPGSTLPDNEYVWLLYVFHLLPFVCVATAWRRARGGAAASPHEWRSIAALAVLAVLVNIGLLRGNLSVWLPDGIALPAILGAWLVAVAWRSRRWRPGLRAVATAFVVLTAAAVCRAGDLDSQIDRSRLQSGLGPRIATLQSQLWGSHRAAGMTPSGVSNALLPFFEYLARCTNRDDRLLMAQLYPDVFVLAERGFAAGHVAFLEGFYISEADQQLALARMRRESVPFVLLIRSREEVFRDNFELLQRHIDGRYRLMADFAVEETDAVNAYVDTTSTPLGTDASTGWPCFR